jgi:ketosteroid isomerase-like protein
MRRSLACVLVLLAGCTTTAVQRERAEGLANAERAFAASAATAGVKTAFLGALADDATVFRPGPVDAKAAIAAEPESPFRLAWQPQRVAVAASDDLGWSTGPFRLTPDARPDEALHGQFFSVWRRDADGRWRVLIDHGVGHPAPFGWTMPLETLAGDGSSPGRAVEMAEAEFARTSDVDGLDAAYRSLASARVRLLRDDSPPIDGLDAVARRATGGARWTWTPTDSGSSRAGDLAWVMGGYRAPTSVDGSSSGFYVRVWQVERGEWKIIGDVLAPIADVRR